MVPLYAVFSIYADHFLERMLTVSEPCRLQYRNAYQYLIEAMEANFAGMLAPPLLPQARSATAA